MELLESIYFQIWIGIGVVVAIGFAIMEGSNAFDQSVGEFKDDEFSMGFFVFFVLLGPIALAGFVILAILLLIRMPGEKKRDKAYQLELEKQKEEERKRLKEEKRQFKNYLTTRLPELHEISLRGFIEPNLSFVEEVDKLATQARSLKLAETTDDQKKQIFGLVKACRLNINVLMAESKEKDIARATKKSSEHVTKIKTKFKRALGS